MKKEKLPTRKRLALRRFLRAALILLAANYICNVGMLLPIQAIRKAEERVGVTHTRVVTRSWAPEMYTTHLFYLTGNEAVTTLVDTHLDLLGWDSGFGCALDCTEEAPFYVGERSMVRDKKNQHLWYYFGRVDDPEIAEIVISIQAEHYENGEPVRREESRFSAPESDWYEQDGRQYFLLREVTGTWPYEEEYRRPVAIALDAAGRELVRLEIDQGTYSSYG